MLLFNRYVFLVPLMTSGFSNSWHKRDLGDYSQEIGSLFPWVLYILGHGIPGDKFTNLCLDSTARMPINFIECTGTFSGVYALRSIPDFLILPGAGGTSLIGAITAFHHCVPAFPGVVQCMKTLKQILILVELCLGCPGSSVPLQQKSLCGKSCWEHVS